MSTHSYCGHCGRKLNPGTTFCDSCGHRIDPVPTPPPAVGTPAHAATNSPATPDRPELSKGGPDKALLFAGAAAVLLIAVSVAVVLTLGGDNPPAPQPSAESDTGGVAAETTSTQAARFPRSTGGCIPGGGHDTYQPVVNCVSATSLGRGRVTVSASYCDRTPGRINSFTYTFVIRNRRSTNAVLTSRSIQATQTQACNTVRTTLSGARTPGDYFIRFEVHNHTNSVVGIGRSGPFSIRG